MIEWIKKLSEDLMPEEPTEEVTAREWAQSHASAVRRRELGEAQYRLARRGIYNPTVAELFDERDRAYGVVVHVDLHEEETE